MAKDEVTGGISGEELEAIQQTWGKVRAEDLCKAGSADLTEDNPSGVMSDQEAEGLRAYFQARDAYREAYSTIARAHNLVLKVSWPEASRPSEWEIIGYAQTLGKQDKIIKGHIPVVEYARELDRYSTRHIREFLNIPTDITLGTRALRLTVMRRLRPIYDLDEKQFWEAFWQCVACMNPFFWQVPRPSLTHPPQVITDSG